MRSVRIRWKGVARVAAVVVATAAILSTLPGLLHAPAPPPLGRDVGLRGVASDRTSEVGLESGFQRGTGAISQRAGQHSAPPSGVRHRTPWTPRGRRRSASDGRPSGGGAREGGAGRAPGRAGRHGHAVRQPERGNPDRPPAGSDVETPPASSPPAAPTAPAEPSPPAPAPQPVYVPPPAAATAPAAAPEDGSAEFAPH